MAKIIVYTTESCPYCIRAKKLLSERGIPFEERKISYDDDAQWDALFAKSGMKTVPQIFHGDTVVGGYDDLAALDRENQLASLR